MIVSASRRTDIPAHFYPWLLNRFAAGAAYSVNPFNPRQIRRVALDGASARAIVLWSKYPAMLLETPPPIPWYLQFTLNDYPPAWEELPPARERVVLFRALAGRYGPEHLVWPN